MYKIIFMQSLKFKKIYNFKPIALIIAMIFFLNNMAYGIDISGKSCLRAPLISNPITKEKSRLKKGLIEVLGLEEMQETSFTRCQPGEIILGQDEKVAGYADRLLLTNEEKASMQKKGIFVYDIDKTLAGRNKPLLEQTIQTIEKLMRTGHLVVIITGQPIDIQRDRVISPIDPLLRRNLIVVTNEGTSAHHFLKDGREYVVKNDFTNKFAFTEEQGRIMKEVVDEFMEENGFEYAPGGEFEPREMTQAAFKIEATLETRTQYAANLEKELKKRDVNKFRGWASGSSTISFLHKDADKRKAGLGFLKEQGFKLKNAVYHGDEFFPGGNDYCIKEDNDIYIAVVGRYDKNMEERKAGKVLSIGGGPYATTSFADDFMAEERLLGEKSSFRDIMANVASKNINIETTVSNLQKSRSPREALEYLAYERLPEGSELRNLMDKALNSGIDVKNKDLTDRVDIQKLTDFICIMQNYKVGPVFINSLYEQMFGNSIEKDFILISALIEDRLFKDSPLDFNVTSRENFLLRDLLASYSDLFTILLGNNAASNFARAVEKLTRQDQVWRYNKTERENVIKSASLEIERVKKALGLFFEESGVFRWLLAAFGNNLSSFNEYINIEDLTKPVLDIKDEIPEKDLSELTSGFVALSGGGGAKFLSTVMLEAKVHNFALPLSEKMPFIMIVPAEDDGGGTAIVCHIGKKKYYFKFPAMGDSMNAYSGLSSGERNDLGDSKFPYFYDIVRERFPLEGIDPLMDEFSQIAFSVIQTMVYNKSTTSDDWKKGVSFFRSMFKVLDKFDLIPVEGQSMGNLIWTASADELVKIAKSKGNPSELKELTEDQIVAIQRFLAKNFGLDNMMVIPSNLNPGTIYGLLDKLVIDDGEVNLVNRKELTGPKDINVNGKQLTIKEEIKDVIDEENGQTYIDYDLKEGEEIFISHRNKEIPLSGSAMFRAHIKKENGKLSVRFNIGAEPWGDWHVLGDLAEVVGIPNDYIKTQAPDQLKWGARVCGTEGGSVLRIYADRVGSGTTLRFNDGKKIMIKARIIAKQTNITENYHLSKIYKVGFIGKEKPKANPFIVKALRNSKVGCVFGPGSTVTSLAPILLLDEIRTELKKMAERGLPIVYVNNPYKDNETAFASISEIMDLFEDSCGEPVFGLKRGGFVTDMVVNNVETMPDDLRRLMKAPDPKKTQLRPAERPRGELKLTLAEKIRLKKWLGEDFGIHKANIATVILKEVRGGTPEKGIGYDFRAFGKVLENIIVSRTSSEIKESSLYKDALAIFNNEEPSLSKAITYLRRAKGYWSEAEVLRKIRDLFNTKGVMTKEVLGKIAPKLLVLNLSHSILETDYIRNPEKGTPFTKEMKEAMVSYVKAGGRIVITTGLDFSIIKNYIFGGDNAIEKEFRSSIYFITLSGAELRRGENLLPRALKPIPQKARNIINKVLKIYGLDTQNEMFSDYGTFINLKLHAFNALSQNDIQELNAEIFRNTSLNLRAHERRAFSIEWNPGLVGTYDLREAIVEHIQKLFDEAGIDLSVEVTGKGSIDIGNLSEVNAFKDLADKTGNFDGAEQRDMLFIPSGGALSEISETFPNAMYLTLPTQDPGSIFINNSMIYQLSEERNPIWTRGECRTLFEMAAAALLKAKLISNGIRGSFNSVKMVSDNI
jgi:HAD superfamily hydrolase (TIGR01484 family)